MYVDKKLDIGPSSFFIALNNLKWVFDLGLPHRSRPQPQLSASSNFFLKNLIDLCPVVLLNYSYSKLLKVIGYVH
ncbi:hypothetical protein AB945B12_03023 [Acinetobacter baumannii]|nr:hypothetical protein AB945B12_03023 [Acinetobacter baumannii]